MTNENPERFADIYRATLLEDVAPFWLRHGLDREHGGFLTALGRDGAIVDTDKSVWFQGRGAWLYATLFNTVERRPEWKEAAGSAIAFLRRHCRGPEGKLYFSVTREGRPLRMRRYVYSECFAAIAMAAWARASGEEHAADEARAYVATYLRHSFEPGVMPAKTDPDTRPAVGLGPHMMAIVTAQELRENLGDVAVSGRNCSAWIDRSIDALRRYFVRPDLRAVLECTAPDGALIDHADGRMLNPGHAIEAAWFVMREGEVRGDRDLMDLGLVMLDWSLERGWDREHGGLLYFTDLHGLPVQEYWHDMKFWWPHCEAIIATLMARRLTGEGKWAAWHRTVHDWSFAHFPDPGHGEWYGYLHRDGTPSSTAKGSLWKGPFHLPRMLLLSWRLCGTAPSVPA